MISKLLLFMFLISWLNGEVLKNGKFENAVIEEVTSIYDGDTFRANIKNYPKIVGYIMSIRINGIDTPEMKAKCTNEKKPS